MIDLQDQVQYEAHRLSNPERIYFDLHDTTLAPDLANKSIAVWTHSWCGSAWPSQ